MQELTIRDAAPDATVQDAAGAPLRLSTLWQGRFATLVFLRHYG